MIRCWSNTAFVGELALSGAVRSVRGVLPAAIEARRRGKKALFVPETNAREAAMVEGIDIYGVQNLRQTYDFISGKNDDPAADTRRSDGVLRQPPKLRSRFQRRKRPGARQARHRGRGRRRAQPAHDRPARLRQIDALQTHRHHHPAHVARGSDRDHEDPQHRRHVERRAGLRRHAALPLARITPSPMSAC